jgi:hypothetical protein
MYNNILFTRFQYFWWCHKDNNHQFSNLYKTIFPRMKMVIVHNPIHTKWFNNLSYLSKQIYFGVIWKSHAYKPFVVISTNRKAVFEEFFSSKNLKCCLISKSPVVFLVYICLFSQKTEDYATKEINHWYINHGKVLKRVFSLAAILGKKWEGKSWIWKKP